MSNQLTFKHINSLILKDKKLKSQESGIKNVYLQTRRFRASTFFIVISCIFLVFWFIICPLTWAFCRSSSASRYWFNSWPIVFWAIAFITWVIIMIFLIIIWKFIKTKGNVQTNTNSYYGSDGINTPLHLLNENKKLMTNEETDSGKVIALDLLTKDVQKSAEENINDPKSDTTVHRQKKNYDLPPLVIHKRMSENNIENTNQDEESKESNIQESNVTRNSIKDYLQLVTVTPSE